MLQQAHQTGAAHTADTLDDPGSPVRYGPDMATQRIVTLVCDGCGREDDGVKTRRLVTARTAVSVEACNDCWAPVRNLAKAGRRIDD